MRRIGRWMLNALTALSLLLCVGTCVLWVRSKERHIALWTPKAFGRQYRFVLYSGTLQAKNGMDPGERKEEWIDLTIELQMKRPREELARLEAMRSGLAAIPKSTWSFAVRTSILCEVASCVAAAALLGEWLTIRRQRHGGCTNCRYDLTGNVSGVCPECGMKINGI